MKNNKNKYLHPLIIFLIILGAKLLVNLSFKTLVQTTGADEIGTIAGAAYFAGLDWTGIIPYVSYYGFGFSIFMAPLFMIFENPVLIFRCMLAMNAACIAGIGVVAYKILDDIYEIKDKKISTLIAFASALYTGVLINSNCVYNECMVSLLGFVMLYLLLKMQKRKDEGKSNLILSIVLTLVMVYSLLVHTRSFYLWGAALVFVGAYLIIKRKIIVNIIPFIVLGAPGYILVKKATKFVQDDLWLANGNGGELANSIDNLGGYFSNITYVFSKDGLKGFILTVVGQIYGMITTSGGLYAILLGIFVCATIYIVIKLVKKEKVNIEVNMITTGLFVLSFMVAVVCLTAIGIADVNAQSVAIGEGSKWYLYVRYWGMIGGIMNMYTLVCIHNIIEKAGNSGIRAKYVALTTGIIVLFDMSIFMLKIAGKFGLYKIASSNVFMNYAPLAFANPDGKVEFNLFFVLTIVAVIMLVILLVMMSAKKEMILVILVLVVSIYSYGYVVVGFDSKASNEYYNEFVDINEQIRKLGIPKGKTIYLNVDYPKNSDENVKYAIRGDKIYLYCAQFWLYDYKISLQNTDLKKSDVVITNMNFEKYEKAGFNVVYKKVNSKYFYGLTVLQKT